MFSLYSTKSGIDKINLDYDGKCIFPFITRSEKNNGLNDIIPKQIKDLNDGNTISIGLDTQTVFYQPNNYYTGQNIQVLSNALLNKEIAFFVIPMLKIQLKNLSWGGSGATLSRLKAKRILLPITQDKTPNWDYMEQYIVNIMKPLYVPKLESFKTSVIDLKSVQWKEFEIRQIFDQISSVKGKTIDNYPTGKTPYVTTSAINNGLTDYISTDKKIITYGNVITIDPIKGKAFYHVYDFVGRGGAGSAINVLESIRLNKNIGLFLSTIIESNSLIKASYGTQLNGKRLKKQKVMIPITDKGIPNWQFMDDYIKSISNSNLI